MALPLIAIVDGESVFLTLMDEILTDAGYQVHTALWQADTYATLRNAPPALLVIDIPISQPETFWTLISQLRRDPATATLPILVCSAASNLLHDSMARLHSLRCVVLEKPFDLGDLLRQVRDLLDSPVMTQDAQPSAGHWDGSLPGRPGRHAE